MQLIISVSFTEIKKIIANIFIVKTTLQIIEIIFKCICCDIATSLQLFQN